MSDYAIQLGVFAGLTLLVAALTWWRCRRAVPSNDQAKDYFLAGGTLAWPFMPTICSARSPAC